MSSTSSELPSGSWAATAGERLFGLQMRPAIRLQALGRSVVSAAVTVGGVRAGDGDGALPPQRHGSSQLAAAAASRRPTGSGTGGAAGSPGDADDDGALLAAAAASPSPSPGLTAEMALSILVDCFGH